MSARTLTGLMTISLFSILSFVAFAEGQIVFGLGAAALALLRLFLAIRQRGS